MDTTFFTHDVRIGAVGYVTNPPGYARMVVIEVSELIAIKKSFWQMRDCILLFLDCIKTLLISSLKYFLADFN